MAELVVENVLYGASLCPGHYPYLFVFFFTSVPPHHQKQPPATINPLLPSYPHTRSIARSNLSLYLTLTLSFSFSLFPHLCVRIHRIVMLCYVRLLHYRSVCKFTRAFRFAPHRSSIMYTPSLPTGYLQNNTGRGKKKVKVQQHTSNEKQNIYTYTSCVCI